MSLFTGAMSNARLRNTFSRQRPASRCYIVAKHRYFVTSFCRQHTMAWLGTIANNVLRKFADVPPNVVQEVRPEQYTNRRIHSREDGIVLYGPGESKNQDKYEIVLHRPCTETLHQAYRYILSPLLFRWHKLYRERDPF